MSDDSEPEANPKNLEEDKRIRRLYQSLLQRCSLSYWTILDFPYLAEIVRHDSSYLQRILNSVFADHPALSHYLSVIACKENCQCQQLPVGFERTLWVMYKRQAYLNNVWSPDLALNKSRIPTAVIPQLGFGQFMAKIKGVPEEEEDVANHNQDTVEVVQ